MTHQFLRTGDILHCGVPKDDSFWHKAFSWLTRVVTCGNGNNPNVATHSAMVLEIEGQVMCVEMIGPKHGLRLSSLEMTHDRKTRNIISASRNVVYDDELKRNALVRRCMRDLRKTIGYDVKGLLEFVFKRLKDDPKRLICSEYVYQTHKDDGVMFPNRFEVRVSPYDLQMLGKSNGYRDIY